jgi:hypothetical protein
LRIILCYILFTIVKDLKFFISIRTVYLLPLNFLDGRTVQILKLKVFFYWCFSKHTKWYQLHLQPLLTIFEVFKTLNSDFNTSLIWRHQHTSFKNRKKRFSSNTQFWFFFQEKLTWIATAGQISALYSRGRRRLCQRRR